MKNIFMMSILILTYGLVKAQSNREDIEIRWPKAEAWKPDEKLSIQTDFSRRRQKWDLKHDSKENWQKMVERLPVTIKFEIPAVAKDKFKSKMSCSVKVATAP